MDVGGRIRRAREAANVSQVELARTVGVTANAVSQWETQGVTPRLKTLQEVADALRVPLAALAGDMPEPVPTGRMVPILGYTHMGAAVDQDECGCSAEVPAHVVDAHPGCYLVHAEGDCMDRRYPPDSLLLIDPSMRPRQGCAVLAEFDDRRTVVRAYHMGRDTLMLCADSFAGDYPDIVVRPDDPPVTLKGVVVWYQAEKDVR